MPPDRLTDYDAEIIEEFRSHKRNKYGEPARPMNSFMVFRKAKCQDEELKAQAAETGEKMSTIISRIWRNLPKEEKEECERIAHALRDKHAADNPDYRYRPRRKKPFEDGCKEEVESDEEPTPSPKGKKRRSKSARSPKPKTKSPIQEAQEITRLPKSPRRSTKTEALTSEPQAEQSTPGCEASGIVLRPSGTETTVPEVEGPLAQPPTTHAPITRPHVEVSSETPTLPSPSEQKSYTSPAGKFVPTYCQRPEHLWIDPCDKEEALEHIFLLPQVTRNDLRELTSYHTRRPPPARSMYAYTDEEKSQDYDWLFTNWVVGVFDDARRVEVDC
ncbi:hypothetical protein CPC08DRAFT_762584 [Agrocybe pediades]|nr:hypothetical protein CPC08DRAFT_762584 [Agrocybe pediades]